jgi:hypothetical protein
VFEELSSLWDRGPVLTPEYEQFIIGIAEGSKRLLEECDGNQEAKMADIEAFVRQHIHNMNLFRANRNAAR